MSGNRHGIFVLAYGFLKRLALREGPPASLVTCNAGHAFCHRATACLGTIKVEASLKNPVGEQVIEAGICALNDQCGKRRNGTGCVLNDAAHDALKAAGQSVQLVMQRGRQVHVSAHQVAVPANSNTSALHVAGTPHRYGVPAANAVQDVVTNDAAGITETGCSSHQRELLSSVAMTIHAQAEESVKGDVRVMERLQGRLLMRAGAAEKGLAFPFAAGIGAPEGPRARLRRQPGHTAKNGE